MALGGAEGSSVAPGARFRHAGLADVVSAKDLLVAKLFGDSMLSEEGGVGGGGDVLGGEAEVLHNLPARIELRVLCPLEGRFCVNCAP